MARAARLAIRHLASRLDDRPLFIVGYSTATIAALLADPERDFALSVLNNKDPKSPRVIERRRQVGDGAATERQLGLRWPNGVYSLAHVALPFDPDDPLYGGDPEVESPGIRLGNLDLRGERGVLRISGSDILRLRWNPFYPNLEERLFRFFGLGGDAAIPAKADPAVVPAPYARSGP